jgi:hypothetical protein
MIAIAPSPTADATRFTDPWRTSPAAKTPAWLLSSVNGWVDRVWRTAPAVEDCFTTLDAHWRGHNREVGQDGLR